MKTISFIAIFTLIVSLSWTDDIESYDLINRLLSIQKPGMPVIYEDSIIFTADTSIRKIGVAFAHENFSTVYWFQQLLAFQDWLEPVVLPGQKAPSPYKDSGIQFYIYQVPVYLNELEYRLVVNGLWTTDPVNQKIRKDPVSGLSMSVLPLPARPANHHPINGLPEGLKFSFKGPPGEMVTVAGSFNGWDPFMYELKEGPAGVYSLTLPLPPGTYQYVFFHRGIRYADPYNPLRIYSRDGRAASEITIP
jgi:hypothetical protein